MQDMHGKVALVTGGGSGIGRGLAHALAAEGCAVGVADILPANAETVAEEIAALGGKSCAVICDVSDRSEVKAMKAAVERELGSVSLLFANAGATSFEPITEMSEDDVDWIVQVNLMGPTNCAMVFLQDMIDRRSGHICATASMAGLMPSWVPNHAPYSAAKMGVIGLMMNLRLELAQHNVGTTIYCPGGVNTGMKANNSRYRPQRFGGPVDEEVDLHGFENPFEFLSPEQVAVLVLDAVRNNRPLVVDHADQREIFEKTYVDMVLDAFSQIENAEPASGVGNRRSMHTQVP